MPTDDDCDDLLLSCRYGDLPDVQAFVAAFSSAALNDAVDDYGNTILHMAAGNGHAGKCSVLARTPGHWQEPADVLAYLLPRVSSSLIAQQNHAGSTPLHWATLNAHLGAAQALVRAPNGPGVDMINTKNTAGRSALGEAEMAGWDEGARWFVEVMKLDEDKVEEQGDDDPSKAIEVEIQDADGQVARMTIQSDKASS